MCVDNLSHLFSPRFRRLIWLTPASRRECIGPRAGQREETARCSAVARRMHAQRENRGEGREQREEREEREERAHISPTAVSPPLARADCCHSTLCPSRRC